MQSVIIIGGSGFLGSAITQVLHERGYVIYAVQNKTPIIKTKGVVIVKGGIKGLTAQKIQEINPKVIYHVARSTFARFRKWGRKLAARKASKLNVHLLKQIKKSGITAPLVFASGSLAYGNSDLAHNEQSPINPISYARQYIVGEMPLIEAVKKNDVRVRILRFPWILGDGSWFSWFYLKNIRELKKVPVFGCGNNIMLIINVHDAANLMVEYGERNIGNGIYNVYSQFTPTQREFVELIAKKFDCDVVDYMDIYHKGLEKAVTEAFMSNILLTSDFCELIDTYPFSSPEETISEM